MQSDNSDRAASRRRAVKFTAIVFAAGIALAIACLNPFAPKLGDVSTNLDLILTEQTSPEDVLVNFRYAYILKDSLVYRDLLDDDFVFVWRDHDNDQFVSWGKEEDIKTTVGLFNAFNVVSLVWNTTNYITYSADSTEAEMSKQFILTLGSDIRITGDAQFFFRQLSNGVWKITRWVDKSIV